MKRESNSVVLVMSHLVDKEVEKHFEKIKLECSSRFDVIYLCDNTHDTFSNWRDDSNYFLFTLDQVSNMGYPGKSLLVRSGSARRDNPHHKYFNFPPGCTDLSLHLFFRNYPEYDYYWLVEYDVRYTGSWYNFFSYFDGSTSDLIGTTLTRFESVPNWYHWATLDFREMAIKEKDYVRGFFPIYRVSNRALRQIIVDYRRGLKGNYEGLLPTLLLHAGMTVEDIGGDGEFVRPQNINRFYRNTPSRGSLSPGTFVFRPIMHKPGKEPNTLWHPVKYMPPWEIVLAFAKRVYWSVRRRIVA